MSETAIHELVSGIEHGSMAALAKAISLVENRQPGYRDLLSSCYSLGGNATVLGITGPPGAGKSTLIDGLIGAIRRRNGRVAVLAIDPSSVNSSGAVLGDRIRMRHARGDDSVFIRSMSARGATGGIAAATDDAIVLLDGFGFDWIILETVGAGQSEIDVAGIVDLTTVVLTPESGDAVQWLKGGLLEIADVFVVNKTDRPGGDRTVAELHAAIDRGGGEDPPPLVETIATEGKGIDTLLSTVLGIEIPRLSDGPDTEWARRRLRRHVIALGGTLAWEGLQTAPDLGAFIEAIAKRERDPYEVMDVIERAMKPCLEADELSMPE